MTILYRIDNMQSAILLSFVTSSPYRHVGYNLPAPQNMPCYISPYIVYNVYGTHYKTVKRLFKEAALCSDTFLKGNGKLICSGRTFVHQIFLTTDTIDFFKDSIL